MFGTSKHISDGNQAEIYCTSLNSANADSSLNYQELSLCTEKFRASRLNKRFRNSVEMSKATGLCAAFSDHHEGLCCVGGNRREIPDNREALSSQSIKAIHQNPRDPLRHNSKRGVLGFLHRKSITMSGTHGNTKRAYEAGSSFAMEHEMQAPPQNSPFNHTQSSHQASVETEDESEDAEIIEVILIKRHPDPRSDPSSNHRARNPVRPTAASSIENEHENEGMTFINSEDEDMQCRHDAGGYIRREELDVHQSESEVEYGGREIDSLFEEEDEQRKDEIDDVSNNKVTESNHVTEPYIEVEADDFDEDEDEDEVERNDIFHARYRDRFEDYDDAENERTDYFSSGTDQQTIEVVSLDDMPLGSGHRRQEEDETSPHSASQGKKSQLHLHHQSSRRTASHSVTIVAPQHQKVVYQLPKSIKASSELLGTRVHFSAAGIPAADNGELLAPGKHRAQAGDSQSEGSDADDESIGHYTTLQTSPDRQMKPIRGSLNQKAPTTRWAAKNVLSRSAARPSSLRAGALKNEHSSAPSHPIVRLNALIRNDYHRTGSPAVPTQRSGTRTSGKARQLGRSRSPISPAAKMFSDDYRQRDYPSLSGRAFADEHLRDSHPDRDDGINGYRLPDMPGYEERPMSRGRALEPHPDRDAGINGYRSVPESKPLSLKELGPDYRFRVPGRSIRPLSRGATLEPYPDRDMINNGYKFSGRQAMSHATNITPLPHGHNMPFYDSRTGRKYDNQLLDYFDAHSSHEISQYGAARGVQVPDSESFGSLNSRTSDEIRPFGTSFTGRTDSRDRANVRIHASPAEQHNAHLASNGRASMVKSPVAATVTGIQLASMMEESTGSALNKLIIKSCDNKGATMPVQSWVRRVERQFPAGTSLADLTLVRAIDVRDLEKQLEQTSQGAIEWAELVSGSRPFDERQVWTEAEVQADILRERLMVKERQVGLEAYIALMRGRRAREDAAIMERARENDAKAQRAAIQSLMENAKNARRATRHLTPEELMRYYNN